MHWKTEWREYKTRWRQSLIGSNLILSYLPKRTGKSCFKSLKNFVDWNKYIFFSSIWAVPLFLSTARAQFFPIRTSRPANNINIFFLRGHGNEFCNLIGQYNGHHTVCDDHWTINETNLVCRQLGFSGATQARCFAAYGRGSGPIWMDKVNC